MSVSVQASPSYVPQVPFNLFPAYSPTLGVPAYMPTAPAPVASSFVVPAYVPTRPNYAPTPPQPQAVVSAVYQPVSPAYYSPTTYKPTSYGYHPTSGSSDESTSFNQSPGLGKEYVMDVSDLQVACGRLSDLSRSMTLTQALVLVNSGQASHPSFALPSGWAHVQLLSTATPAERAQVVAQLERGWCGVVVSDDRTLLRLLPVPLVFVMDPTTSTDTVPKTVHQNQIMVHFVGPARASRMRSRGWNKLDVKSSLTMTLFTSGLHREGYEGVVLPPSDPAAEEHLAAADADKSKVVEEAKVPDWAATTVPQVKVLQDKDGSSGSGSGSASDPKCLCADPSCPVRLGSRSHQCKLALSISTKLSANRQACRIHVGSVLVDLTSDNIKEVFEPFGTVVAVQLIPDKANPGRHKGHGFVEFADEQSAREAIIHMNDFELCGLKLKVGPASLGGLFGGTSGVVGGSLSSYETQGMG